MSAYNQEFNKDNTILRYLTVGMLAELSKKVYYYNQVDEDTLKKIEVPFFYSISGNERFLLDNFMFDAEKAGKAIGDYEVVPRGIIQMNSMSINADEQTNKFTRAEFVREWDGVLKTFSLMTNFLPITIGFGVTIICSNNLLITYINIYQSINTNRPCQRIILSVLKSKSNAKSPVKLSILPISVCNALINDITSSSFSRAPSASK